MAHLFVKHKFAAVYSLQEKLQLTGFFWGKF